MLKRISYNWKLDLVYTSIWSFVCVNLLFLLLQIFSQKELNYKTINLNEFENIEVTISPAALDFEYLVNGLILSLTE